MAIGKSEHIIEMYDNYEKDNQIYLILEFCNQGSLKDYYNEKQKQKEVFSEEEAKKILY